MTQKTPIELKKSDNDFITDYVNLEVKLAEVDEEGTFEGYAAVFGNVDIGYDLLEKGAFTKTLEDRPAKQVKLLYQHDRHRPIGVIKELKQDSKGLWVKGKLNVNTALGAEVKSNMKEGVLDSLSIGYRATKFEYVEKNKMIVRQLKEVELWEVSVVTFPANPKATIRSIKSQDFSPSVNVGLEVIKYMANFIKEKVQ